MNIPTTVSVLKEIFQPIESMCSNFEVNLNEESSEEWFCKFKMALEETWGKIYIKLLSYNIDELDNYLQISTSIKNFFKLNSNTKLSSYLTFQQFLDKHYLVRTCLSLLILENYREKRSSRIDKQECLEELIKDKSEELKKSVGLNTILLCVNQIEVCLIFLIQTLYEEFIQDIILNETRRYITQRLKWCLHFFSQQNDAVFCNQPDSGSFMEIMDTALDLLTQVNPINQIYSTAKATIDELLCHAMSICQIAITEDTIIIKSACQKVLNECEELNRNLIENQSISVVNLMIDSVSDALCSLEQKVNIAVLKLLLEVYKHSDRFLQNLIYFCESTNVNRSVNDLDDVIIPFDLQVDRIMQIGYFAVACSTHKQRVLRMRSALASLESLESELVPALTAYYIDKSVESKTHAMILVSHWKKMVDVLQDLINLIVDPIAFSQVVLDSSLERVEKLNLQSPINDFNEICAECDLLLRHLNICIPEAYKIQPDELIQYQKVFKNVLGECKASVRVLLIENEKSTESMKRVMKRFRILVSYMKKIWNELVISSETEKDITAFETKFKSQYISKIKLDEILEQPKKQSSATERNLAMIMIRGEILRKERSILYQTPKKVNLKEKLCLATPLTKFDFPITPKSKRSNRDNLTFARKLDNLTFHDEEESHVEVSGFLEQLTEFKIKQ